MATVLLSWPARRLEVEVESEVAVFVLGVSQDGHLSSQGGMEKSVSTMIQSGLITGRSRMSSRPASQTHERGGTRTS